MAEPAMRHPFIDDLGADVVLVSSVLRRSVQGRDLVLKVVKAGAGQYLTQMPRFLGSIGERSYFEYDVTLADNLQAAGLVSILRNATGEVTHLHIAFSPLGSVLAIAAGAKERLTGELDAELFL